MRQRPRWRSERWQLRRGNLFLMPGDSPLGLRLPISSLPYIPPEDYPYIIEQDPLAPRDATCAVVRTRPRRRPTRACASGRSEQHSRVSGGGAHGDVDRNP